MAMKELFYRLRPFQIYIVLALSIIYFFVQLFLSHVTHALTLLVDSYHMLCNIVALSGCITTIKHCNAQNDNKISSSNKLAPGSFKANEFIEISETKANQHENSLRNTFGWTRIDILTRLIVGIFLAAFCFSLLIEAIQTLIHIDHNDAMHFPKAVFVLGIGGLILNGFCYLLIGGYTYHQGNFLHITSSGDVVSNRVGSSDGLFRGNCQLSKTNHGVPTTISVSSIQLDSSTSSSTSIQTQSAFKPRKYTLNEFLRDISSTIFVIICSIIVYFADSTNFTKYVDPIISIVSCITLLVLSYPYMKESCLILLQTIPASIDIESFKVNLLKTFDDIVSVHDLHIWQLTSSKYVSTVHILFRNPNVYVDIKDSLFAFFLNQGITIVTIQPEFKEKSNNETKDNSSLTQCLIGCRQICAPKTCCSTNDLDTIVVNDGKKKCKYQKPKTGKKSNSMLNLNVSSLSKLRKLTGCSQEIIKKSVSESQIGQVNISKWSDLQTTSADISVANNLDIMHNSIDELSERKFNNGCDSRINERLSPIEQQPNSRKTESKAEHEDSSLLNRHTSNTITTGEAKEHVGCLPSKL